MMREEGLAGRAGELRAEEDVREDGGEEGDEAKEDCPGPTVATEERAEEGDDDEAGNEGDAAQHVEG